MRDFVHLHVHSEYSLLDGACRISKAVKAAAEMGQKALAITDHGVMYGVYDFWKAAKEAGIHPVIGCEVYCAPRSRFSRVHELDAEAEHLVLLCENQTGYKNLMKLVSAAFTEGFYIKPRVDTELLRAHSEGLICLSACLAGRIPRLLAGGQYDSAKAFALELADIFGPNNFFLEMQDHGIPSQRLVNAGLLRIAAETGLPLVATNDAHYIAKSDAELQDVLMCIQMVKKVDDTDRMKFPSSEFYLKSGDEMEALFGAYPGALENTVRIAERCHVEFSFNGYIQPRFPLPAGERSADDLLKKMCLEGFARRYGPNPPAAYRERLDYELSVIQKMGFSDYYLIVADYVNFAKRTGIPVGPGRGSGAGSIAAYCMGITNLCPMKYELYFERFLNPERISMPDFDVDFCPKRRGEMIDYMVRTYGADRVTQIITFGTMAARAVIRDVGRVLDVPYADVDRIAKMVPNELHMNLNTALEKSPVLKEAYDQDLTVRKLIDIARGLEGMPRNASTHAAGIVVAPEPTVEYVPLSKNDEAVVTQFPMNTIADIGLVKMDFLGLRNLTIIDDSVRMIQKNHPDFSLDAIPDDDGATFEMLAQGKTCGVFQLESAGMTNVTVNLKAQSIEEICAVIALYRPGPMEQIPKYIDGKMHPERVTYRHPLLKEVLDVTYGCPLYQEQVMEIFRKLAGYSMGRADLVRRAMSKKKADVLEKEKQNFIYGNEAEGVPGCGSRGIPPETAEAIFSDIQSFASYGFNKAHSAAYALVCYQTAYLKCHFPGEYMGALLSSVLGDAAKVAVYSAECKNLGISILPPNVNRSEDSFIVEDGNIRFGLAAIRNVGAKVILDMVAERRKNGEFKDFADWCRRMSDIEANKRAVEGLIMAGACDCFELYRSQMIAVYESVMDTAAKARSQRIEGQYLLFGEDELPETPPLTVPVMKEYSRRELLSMEKTAAGIYLSGHPLDDYAADFEWSKCTPLGKLVHTAAEDEAEGDTAEEAAPMAYTDAQMVTVGGMISAVKQKTTKSNQIMAFVTLEDRTGSMEVLIFPKILTSCGGYIRVDNAVVLTAKVSEREGEDTKLVCESCRQAKINAMVEQEQAAQKAVPMQSAHRQPEQDESNRRTIYDDRYCEPIRSASVPDVKPADRKLFLKVATRDSRLFQRLKGMFAMFPGDMPVVIWVSDEKVRLGAGADLTVNDDPRFLKALTDLLGEGCVVVK